MQNKSFCVHNIYMCVCVCVYLLCIYKDAYSIYLENIYMYIYIHYLYLYYIYFLKYIHAYVYIHTYIFMYTKTFILDAINCCPELILVKAFILCIIIIYFITDNYFFC